MKSETKEKNPRQKDAKWCPVCEHESRVCDVRDEGNRTMRRRRCVTCGQRWTTFEFSRDVLREVCEALNKAGLKDEIMKLVAEKPKKK